MKQEFSRRAFFKMASAATALNYGGRALTWARSVSETIQLPAPLETFSYAAVQIQEGPMKRQFDDHHSLFLHLDDDRLLKVFRQKAGLPAPGEDMGGWYDLTGFDLARNDFDGFVPGHSFGQYLSALARAYAITGSQATRDKVDRLVKGYAGTLDDKATFFAGYRLPAYTYDKLSCGLIDAYEFCKNPLAMDVHEKLTRAMVAYLPEKALSRPEQRARPHKDDSYTWDESYTLPENLFLAYQRSGKAFYRDMAVRYLEDDTYFDPLAEGKNVLPGEHAYSHVNAFSSAMQAYLTLGSQKHLLAARNGFDMLASTQSYATGGWGPNEAFVEPDKGLLGESLGKTHASFETPCGAYGHFKITRYLLRVTKDSRYGDSMERVLYNTILGAKPIQPEGWSFYYSDYGTTGKKGYHRDKWPCCSGTLPQLAADYHISVYLHSPEGVYVNLFVPSSLSWISGNTQCRLEQRTNYPFNNQVEMRISVTQPVEYTTYVRIPEWPGSDPVLSVNGRRVSAPVRAGEFAAIRRTWKDGDRIELELPMPLRLGPVDPQHTNLMALMRGPLVLFALADSQPSFHRSDLFRGKDANNPNGDWLVTAMDGNTTIMRPFMSIQDEKYSTYVSVAM